MLQAPYIGELRKPSVVSSFEVTEWIGYKVYGAFNQKSNIGLKEGKYTAFFENDIGVFYMCPEGCVRWNTAPIKQSGIYVPKDKNLNPLLFNYKGAERTRKAIHDSNNKNAWTKSTILSELFDSDIMFFPEIEDKKFLERLHEYIENRTNK